VAILLSGYLVPGHCEVPEMGGVVPDEDEAGAVRLARLGAQFFRAQHTANPFAATQLGVPGFDALVPSLHHEDSARTARQFREIEDGLAAIDAGTLSDADRVDHAVLKRLVQGARSELEHPLWEASASAGAYASPQGMLFSAVPGVTLRDAAAVQDYLSRLAALPAFVEAVGDRYRQARAAGRPSTQVGVRQAIAQLEGHLSLPVERDRLRRPVIALKTEHVAAQGRAQEIVSRSVRPAVQALLRVLRDELLPDARPDDEVGIGHVRGGEEGYRAALRRHTTTDLSPDEVHRIGLDCVAELRAEWDDLGRWVLGTGDIAATLSRLREDRSLRFTDRGEIMRTVRETLNRAEQACGDWFPSCDLPDCVVEEIDPIDSDGAPLAYYRPAAEDGSRPGTQCVLTTRPQERFVHDYEALAFHEGVPGHHLQIASAQRLVRLPDHRRFLDTEVCGYVEGWGLYSERLADEMGLYTSDLARLGMVSAAALRACRLVVDTGMHHLGWSRRQALQYMWENTAATKTTVHLQVDRCLCWPGQAPAYVIGLREIVRLRALAEHRLGRRFDVRAFHATVLNEGALPLGVLEQVVVSWIRSVLHPGRPLPVMTAIGVLQRGGSDCIAPPHPLRDEK
jgi:uncharacterized protein (DUF885 family)